MELSIIIPTYNEEHSLPKILYSLTRQRAIDFELIIADGRSTDLTPAVARNYGFNRFLFISEATGKAQQLNAGAAQASGDFLLFIHADSIFRDDMALRKGLDCLLAAEAASGGRRYAGHFCLKFLRKSIGPTLGYTYYENKARVNRSGCTHGDQGLMLSRELFAATGPFSESCQLLAETRFADKLRSQSALLLLPADILTSARRFEREGLRNRQILNAVIMALGAVGQDQLINGMPNLYREQSQCGGCDIYPLLVSVREKLTALSIWERWLLWEHIGGYARDNAWQIPFYLDVRKGYKMGDSGSVGQLYWLEMFERFEWILTGNRVAAICAGIAARVWFNSLLLRGKKGER